MKSEVSKAGVVSAEYEFVRIRVVDTGWKNANEQVELSSPGRKIVTGSAEEVAAVRNGCVPASLLEEANKEEAIWAARRDQLLNWVS